MSAEENHDSHRREAQFMRLFVKHEPILRAYARSILPDWNSVDDALQEASVTMWEKLDQLRNDDGFLPWAKVIVRFKCLSAAATLRRRRPILSDEVLQLLADDAEPLQAKQFANVRRALEKCLAEFTAAQQELLLAPYEGPLRIKNLAERSGKTANAFYKLVARLRSKLARCIKNRTQMTGA